MAGERTPAPPRSVLPSPAHPLRQLSRAVEQSPSITLITDAAGRIEYVNPKFTQVTGYTLAEVVGQNPRLLKSGMTTAEEYQCLWETITSGNEWRGEMHNRRKSGEPYWVFASVSPIKDPAGTITHFVAVQEDVTERKRAEDEIRILNQELEQRVSERSAQLEAANRELETFSHSVSHDLRAPLRAIDGFGKALQEEYAHTLDAQGQHYLERVLAGTQQMGQLIDALLSLSRVSRMELHHDAVDLSALAQAIAASFREREPQRRAMFVIAAGLHADGDARLLRVVLENLVGNAWKYTGKHAQARIELGVIEQNGAPVYFVRDDGAGFDMAYAGKLFGAFQRLHSDGEFPGTGIGLATVQRVIHRHGGRIWAEGVVEGGATFYFTLPERLAAPPLLPPST